ncbi:hypothetical protein D3C84_577900 [compost metagenome]
MLATGGDDLQVPVPVFVAKALFPYPRLQIRNLLEHRLGSHHHGNPGVMFEAAFHWIVFGKLVDRSPDQMAGSVADGVLGMDHDTLTTGGSGIQAFNQPVLRAVVIAIEYADMQGFGQTDAGVARQPQVSMVHLKDPVPIAQRGMLADDAAGGLGGAVEHRDQLHRYATARREVAHALEAQQAPMGQHTLAMEVHDQTDIRHTEFSRFYRV